ncbi:hypothetical protein H0H93_016567, partial [Arthromyces matolae]
AIHTSATTVNTAITTTTTDVQNAPVPVSDSDAAVILADLQALQPNISKSLTDVVARKAAFAALPIGGVLALVQSDLKTLNVSTTGLAGAFILQAPANVLPDAETLQSTILDEFASALAALA